MPLQNRVDPFRQLHAVPQRGAWMGNRGILHDEHQRVRWFQSTKRWIICELEFRGIRREVMAPRRYTELFFLDEATALAAGHRPCNTCRREAAQEFRRLSGAGSLSQLNERLHSERTGDLLLADDWNSLPNGTMIGWLGCAYLVKDEKLFRWNFKGYQLVESIAADAERECKINPELNEMGMSFRSNQLRLLTPPTIVAVLRKGYPVQIQL